MVTMAFCTIGFRDEPLREVLWRLNPMGYDATEIFWRHLEGLGDDDLRRLRDMTDELGLPTLAISPYLCFTRGRDEWDASVERAAAVVNAARILGATKIRTFTDVGPTGVGSDVAGPDEWDACIRGLKTIMAPAPELTFLLETHENTLADTPDSVRRLLAAVDAPNLKLLVHPEGGPFGGIEGYRAFADVIDHMHLKNKTPDGAPTWIDQGVFDHEAFFKDVLAEGYSGSVSVEYCFLGATWDLAQSAAEYLREALGKE
ncbi:MAG: sugar phosphate isomerase/epimerase [Planctomycetes bacterium]|nr:sugar phosphate isomerase/epimerase [Planctomycetota bacterium]